MGLAAYKQIRFPVSPGAWGNAQLIINSPGNTALAQAATDTLLLLESTPSASEDYFPHLEDGDIQFTKLFTNILGRRGMNDVVIAIRDGFGYTGTVNGSPVAENFLSIFQTFFDVWLTGTLPYKVFILYADNLTGNSEVSHEGWVDPTYKPISDPLVLNKGTTSQIILGTRTIKMTAFSQAQLNLTWGNLLAAYDASTNPHVPASYTGIASGDCQEGVPYNGFVLSPPGLNGQSNTRATAFSSSTGNWYQAVPYFYRPSLGDPQLVGAPAAVWPATPFIVQASNAIANNGYTNQALGTGYNVGDTGTINGGSPDATYKVIQVTGPGGAVIQEVLTFGGAGYTVGSTYTTTATSGTGTGLTLKVNQVGATGLWGPSGLIFVSIGTLYTKIAQVLGQSTFTPATDLISALSFWAQKADNTNKNFPIDASAAIDLTNLYISFNVFAKSHPLDGSFWDNPAGWSPETPVSEVLTGLSNFILSDFNETYLSDGTSKLNLTRMGATAITVPTWDIIGTPSVEEPATAQRTVTVNNRADDLKIQCPFGIIGDTSAIEIPIRLHRIGNTTGNADIGDAECVLWDAQKQINEQARECFEIAYLNTDGTYTANPNVWKSLCYAYWFNASNSNVVYPSGWNPFPKNDGTAGSWANSFYVANACYANGSTPPANLQGLFKGNDYFNSRDYHAVAFAALTLPLPTVQAFEYFGISDSTGSIQNIVPGMTGTWRDGPTASQVWRAIEIVQQLLGGTTTIKWQAQVGTGGFPALTDLTYAPVAGTGGTSSTTGGNTNSGGVTTPVQTAWNVITKSLTSNTSDLNIGVAWPAVILVTSTGNYTWDGIANPVAGAWIKIFNVGTHFISFLSSTGSAAANQFLFNGGFQIGPNSGAWGYYDSNVSKWRLFV